MSGGAARTSAFLPKPVGYKTLFVDKTGEIRTDNPPRPGPIWEWSAAAVLGTGAAGRAAIRTAGNARYRAPGKPVEVGAQQFAIVDVSTMAVAGISPQTGTTYSQASAVLRGAAARGQLLIVATHELKGA